MPFFQKKQTGSIFKRSWKQAIVQLFASRNLNAPSFSGLWLGIAILGTAFYLVSDRKIFLVGMKITTTTITGLRLPAANGSPKTN